MLCMLQEKIIHESYKYLKLIYLPAYREVWVCSLNPDTLIIIVEQFVTRAPSFCVLPARDIKE